MLIDDKNASEGAETVKATVRYDPASIGIAVVYEGIEEFSLFSFSPIKAEEKKEEVPDPKAKKGKAIMILIGVGKKKKSDGSLVTAEDKKCNDRADRIAKMQAMRRQSGTHLNHRPNNADMCWFGVRPSSHRGTRKALAIK